MGGILNMLKSLSKSLYVTYSIRFMPLKKKPLLPNKTSLKSHFQFMVKRLIRHWTLFSMSNSTQLGEELEASLHSEEDWRGFLATNSAFIR